MHPVLWKILDIKFLHLKIFAPKILCLKFSLRIFVALRHLISLFQSLLCSSHMTKDLARHVDHLLTVHRARSNPNLISFQLLTLPQLDKLSQVKNYLCNFSSFVPLRAVDKQAVHLSRNGRLDRDSNLQDGLQVLLSHTMQSKLSFGR